MIAFTILGQPCSKSNSRQLVKIGGRPAFIKSKEALAYERDAMLQVPVSARQMLDMPVRLSVRVYYASERPDLDVSLIQDILQARYRRAKGKLVQVAPGEWKEAPGERILVQRSVYVNDRLVRELHAWHGVDRAHPRAEIEVEPLGPVQPGLLEQLEAEEDPF